MVTFFTVRTKRGLFSCIHYEYLICDGLHIDGVDARLLWKIDTTVGRWRSPRSELNAVVPPTPELKILNHKYQTLIASQIGATESPLPGMF